MKSTKSKNKSKASPFAFLAEQSEKTKARREKKRAERAALKALVQSKVG